MEFLNQIKSKILQTDRVASITVTLGDGSIEYNGLILKTTKGQIIIEKELSSFDKESLKDLPVIVSFEGKGVLQKNSKFNYNKTKLSNVFPSIKTEDFHSLITPLNEGCLVSIMRIDNIENILKELDLQKEQVLDISFGPCALSNLTETDLDLPSNIDEYAIQYSNNSIENIEKGNRVDNQNNIVFGEEIKKGYQISYLNGISYLLIGQISDNQNYKAIRKEWFSKKTFQFSLVCTLGFLLVFFLGNAIINGKLNGELSEVSKQLQAVDYLVVKRKQIDKEINTKEEFIDKLNLSKDPRYAEFLMDIGKSVPKNIQLHVLEINPIIKVIRKNKEIEINNGFIVIEGTSGSSSQYNLWRMQLKKIDWITNTELIDYQIDKRKVGHFKFKLTY